jgi:hypothetical protein
MGVINPMLQHNESEWSTDRPVAIEAHHRGQSKTLWVFVVVLAAALGALAYYGYHMVKNQDAQITQLFGSQSTWSTLGQRADAAETKLQDLAGDWQGMGQRVTKLEGRVAADVKQTRVYAEKLTQQLHQQMIAEMDARRSRRISSRTFPPFARKMAAISPVFASRKKSTLVTSVHYLESSTGNGSISSWRKDKARNWFPASRCESAEWTLRISATMARCGCCKTTGRCGCGIKVCMNQYVSFTKTAESRMNWLSRT